MDLFNLLPIDLAFEWAGDLLQSEVMKMTISFMLAARLHRKWVKKDMSEQFAKVTAAIDHVADVFGRKYDNHEDRIKALEEK